MKYLLSKLLLLLFLLCKYKMLKAQILPYVKYTTKDGLLADRITSITQDSSGIMWFGTNFGICNYSGQNFSTIQLPLQHQQKFVTTLSANNKEVFAGFLFNGGIVKHSNGQLITLSKAGVETYGSNDVTAINNDQPGKTLVVAHYALYIVKDNKLNLLFDFQKLEKEREINHLLHHEDGSIWAASKNGIFVLKARNGKYEVIEKILEGSNIFSLFKDIDHNIWVGSRNEKTHNIYFFDSKSAYLNKKNIYENSTIKPVKFTGNPYSGFWGIDKKGLFNIDVNGTVNHYSHIVNHDSYVSSIFADRENNIWIANDPGVIKYSHKRARTYFFDKLSAAGGNIIKTINDEIFATNTTSIYAIKDDKFKKLPEWREKEDLNNIGFLAELKNNKFLISRWVDGFYIVTTKDLKIISSSIPAKIKMENIILSSHTKDRNGNIWVGGKNSFFRIREGSIIEKINTEFLPPNFHITAIAFDEENSIMWLGDNSYGISKIKYTVQKGVYAFQLLKHIDIKDGLSDPYVRSMILDAQNNLWIGTRFGGIFKYISRGDSFKIQNITPKVGNSCFRITSMAEEKNKAIWFASCNGIYRYLYKSGNWEFFDISSGLPSAEVFSIVVDTIKKQVWALTLEGVTAISYDIKERSSPPPIANINAIQVLGVIDSNALSAKDVQKQYSSYKNSIGFIFSGASFIDEKRVLYKYKLDGYDSHWSEPTTNNNITYASLPPGNYNFSVIAANADGIWSEKPAIFNFSITLPFYKETWFYILLILIAASSLYLIYILRLKQIMKMQRLRLGIARDLHDDVGSTLSSINLLSETASRKLDNVTAKNEITGAFEKISNSAQNTLEAMDDIIWAINPEKDTWQDLLVRMKEFAIPLMEVKNINFIISADAGDYNILPMLLRRNVFLLFKEAITNSIKYAESTTVEVDIRIINNQLFMVIKDDGKGFDLNIKTNRNGINNFKNRASIVNGKVEVSSVQGNGTTIKFQCPIR
jgi:two-component sensor histidine kinase